MSWPDGRAEFWPDAKALMDEISRRYGDRWAGVVTVAFNDAQITRALLEKLLPQVSRPDVELRLVDQCIRLSTERAFRIDPGQAAALKDEIRREVNEKCTAAGCTREAISGDIESTGLLAKALAPTGRQVPLKPDKNGKPILALSQDDPAYAALQADAAPAVRALVQARTSVESAPAFERRVEKLESIAKATGGRLPAELNYCGAHTGRYSGAGGTNLQNLPKRATGSAGGLSALLQSEEGKVLVGGDASQIEARILARLANEMGLVEAFRAGRDVYCEFAYSVFGEEVRKPVSSDPPEVATRFKALRHIGKQSILGLGYGMGPGRFEEKLRLDPEALPLFESGELDTERVRALVYRDYRETYSAIPEFWNALEQAFAEALLYGKAQCGAIGFRKVGADLHVALPSGRTLRYPKAGYDPQGDLMYSGNKTLWGGKLAENVVQAIGRDFICDIMLRAEEYGYPVLLQVHDEVVLHVPGEDAEKARSFLLESLKTPPSWLPNLPVSGEIWVRKQYGEGQAMQTDRAPSKSGLQPSEESATPRTGAEINHEWHQALIPCFSLHATGSCLQGLPCLSVGFSGISQ